MKITGIGNIHKRNF